MTQLACGYVAIATDRHYSHVTHWRTETVECLICGRVHVKVIDCQSGKLVDESRYSTKMLSEVR